MRLPQACIAACQAAWESASPAPAVPVRVGAHSLGGLLPRTDGVKTALPAMDIDGLKANGERTTWTIPAGKMGNEKPIVTTREVWRCGEQNYRLEKIKRGDPDSALTKPPADFSEVPKRSPSPAASAPTRSV